MPEESPDPTEPKDAFELFTRSFGFIGLIISWVLVYFFILGPWEAVQSQPAQVVYSITAIGITTGVTLWSLALVVIGGIHGSRLVTNLAPARFGWRQSVFVFVWAVVTFGFYVLLQRISGITVIGPDRPRFGVSGKHLYKSDPSHRERTW